MQRCQGRKGMDAHLIGHQVGLAEKGPCEQRFKGWREEAVQRSEEGISGENQEVTAKALGQKRAWLAQRTARRPGSQEQGE